MAEKRVPVYKTRTEMVVDVLRERILSGEIEAGQALRQDAIAKELNVSRIPVREALLQLEAQGLVNFIPHKGAVATELSAEKICELFELRALIEGHILEKAIPNLTAEDIKRAEEILHAFDELLDSGTEVERWSELNYSLHETLYRPANLPQTLEVIEGLNTQCDRYIRMQLLFTAGIDKAEQEHSELIELCRDRKTKKAVALLRQHILGASEAIQKLLIEQQTESV